MTGIQKDTVFIPFGGGVSSKADPKQIPLGKLLALQNVTFQSPGQLKKRNAFPAMSMNIEGGGTLSGGVACFTRQNELLYATGTYDLYSYNASTAKWVSKGKMPSVTATVQSRGNTQFSARNIDQAVASNGLICTVCELFDQNSLTAPQGVAYSVLDPVTGQLVVPLTTFDATATTYSPRVCYVGSNWLITYIRGNLSSTAAILATTLSSTAPTVALPASTTLTSGTTTSALVLNPNVQNYDLRSTGSIAYLAFPNRSGTTGTTTFELLAASPTTVSATATLAATAAINHAIILDPNTDVVVAYSTATAIGAVVYTSNLGSQVANTSVESGLTALTNITGIATAANTISLFYGGGTRGVQYVRTNTLTTSSYTAGTAVQLIRSLMIAGKAFIVSGVVYVPMTFTTDGAPLFDTQASFYIVDAAGNIDSGALAGSIDPPGPGIAAGTAGMVPSTLAAGSIVIAAVAQAARVASVGSALGYQYNPAAVTFNFADTVTGYNTAEAAKCVLASGGVPYMYDGSSPVEMGFLQFPGGTVAAQSGSGALTLLGTYNYFITYEWMDAQGQIHRSAPGPILVSGIPVKNGPITLTGSNQTVTLTIPTLRATAKTKVSITVWRTTDAGNIYFQANNIDADGTLYNDKTADTVTWVDTLSDVQIQGSPQLYTTGGVLANSAPAPIGSLCEHRGRIYAIDPTTGQVQYSQLVSPPAPLEFNDFNVLNTDYRGGFPTAVASLDSNLIIFKQNYIFALAGLGPDATGGQNDFQDPQIISADTGCSNPQSIVLTPQGLMFQSPKGIYLLSRDLSVSYIGADAEALFMNGNSPLQVMGAIMTTSTNQVRFGITSSAQVYFDYLVGQWSSNDLGIGGTTFSTADMCLWQGNHVILTSSGAMVEESIGAFVEGSSSNRISLTTPWIQFGKVEGFQRVYEIMLLGTFRSAHTLIVNLYVDDQTLPFETISIAVTGAPEQFKIRPRIQKCQKMQIQITESAPSGSQESLWLSGFSIRVGVKRGHGRVSAAQSFG